jgi:hypothetical protein
MAASANSTDGSSILLVPVVDALVVPALRTSSIALLAVYMPDCQGQ